MAKKHLSATISEECYDIIMTFKNDNDLTLSQAVEELINLGSRTTKEPTTLKDDFFILVEQAKKIERRILEKEKKKIMS